MHSQIESNCSHDPKTLQNWLFLWNTWKTIIAILTSEYFFVIFMENSINLLFQIWAFGPNLCQNARNIFWWFWRNFVLMFPQNSIFQCCCWCSCWQCWFESTRNSFYLSIVPVVSASFSAGFKATTNSLSSSITPVLVARLSAGYKPTGIYLSL